MVSVNRFLGKILEQKVEDFVFNYIKLWHFWEMYKNEIR